MTTLPLSEVEARLSEIAEAVAATHERVQITKDGRDYVVLLAAEDLESIEATLELLRDPDAHSRVARAEAESGRVTAERPRTRRLVSLRLVTDESACTPAQLAGVLLIVELDGHGG